LGDAATFSPPPGSLLVHIDNPFAKSVLKRVVENLQAAWRNVPRDIQVLLHYNSDSDGLQSMFTERGFNTVTRVGKFTLYKISGTAPDAAYARVTDAALQPDGI
jgi:hypothetical protein